MLGVLVGFASPHVTADPNRAPSDLCVFYTKPTQKKKLIKQSNRICCARAPRFPICHARSLCLPSATSRGNDVESLSWLWTIWLLWPFFHGFMPSANRTEKEMKTQLEGFHLACGTLIDLLTLILPNLIHPLTSLSSPLLCHSALKIVTTLDKDSSSFSRMADLAGDKINTSSEELNKLDGKVVASQKHPEIKLICRPLSSVHRRESSEGK